MLNGLNLNIKINGMNSFLITITVNWEYLDLFWSLLHGIFLPQEYDVLGLMLKLIMGLSGVMSGNNENL